MGGLIKWGTQMSGRYSDVNITRAALPSSVICIRSCNTLSNLKPTTVKEPAQINSLSMYVSIYKGFCPLICMSEHLRNIQGQSHNVEAVCFSTVDGSLNFNCHLHDSIYWHRLLSSV